LASAAIATGCASDPTQSSGATAKTDAVVEFQRFVTLNGYQYAEMAMSNRSSQPLWFTGEQLEYPAYETQYSNGSQWVDSRDSRCAMGLERYQLPSQQSITFTVLVPDDERATNGWRVGVAFSPHEDYKQGQRQVCWSERISPSK
jgi:hypothetical protein